MCQRITRIAVIATIVAGLIAPAASWARPGGFRAAPVHLGAYRFGPHPFGLPHVPGTLPAATHASFVAPGAAHANDGLARLHNHRVSGPGLPLAGIGVYYGSLLAEEPWLEFAAGDVHPQVEITGALPDSSQPVRHGGCDTQTVVVPSEAGGERAITVRRCGQHGRE
jgi:hypothetical protein